MDVLLLDGHNLLYRSFTSLPAAITDQQGQPINAVYGMIGTVMRLTRELGATQAYAAFDVPDVPTFRHLRYPDYQGQRGPLGGEHADDFRRQVEVAHAVLPALGVQPVQLPGYEADDVMATLAERLAPRRTVAIITTDRDLLQLVRTGVSVITPANPPIRADSADDVRARLGVDPERVVDWKALAGDASDNIPGAHGIGTKTAQNLVNKYGALESIYEQVEDLPARARKILEEQRDDLFLFRDLVTVRRDAPLPSAVNETPRLGVEPNTRVRDVLERAGY